MKKLFAAIAVFIALAGCTPSANEIFVEVMPKALEDCKLYEIKSSGGSSIKVMRCPNSTTSTNYDTGGKHRTLHANIVIDGVTYEKKEVPE